MNHSIEINEANFESEVVQSNQLVLVDFWAEWCGPCKMLGPVLEEIALEHNGRVKVAKVNVDTNSQLAERFGIQSIPTLLYFANREIRDKTVGFSTSPPLCRGWRNSPCRHEGFRYGNYYFSACSTFEESLFLLESRVRALIPFRRAAFPLPQQPPKMEAAL